MKRNVLDAEESPTAAQVRVTPNIARQWLERNERNRHISLSLVNRYAAAMKDNRWRENGETIKIGRSGELLDGQHRCHACIRADVPFPSWVVYGIDPDAFDTIDVGCKRTAGQILSIEGCRNGNATAAAYRWQRALNRRAPTVSNIIMDADEIRLAWASDPKIEESVAFVQGECKKIISPGLVGALHHTFSLKSSSAADAFFEDLGTGANLTSHDPVLVLREWLMSIKSGNQQKQRVSDGEKVAKCIRAWNHRRAHRKTKTLRGLIKSAAGYLLPEIE